MPKQTFFNLPIDKQDKLINSATEEFSRAPLHEASISNIVKHAGIARGSFYQYFEDKDDIFFFILDKYAKQNDEMFISLLKENDGDLFDSLIEMYQEMLQAFQNPDSLVFIKNVFLNMNHKMIKALTQSRDLDKFKYRRSEAIHFINIKKLNIAHEQELFHILKITDAVTLQNFIQHFALELSFEESLQNYTSEINLLKRGLYKE